MLENEGKTNQKSICAHDSSNPPRVFAGQAAIPIHACRGARLASIAKTIQLIRIGEWPAGGSTCAPELADDPWQHDNEGYGPGASIAHRLPATFPVQGNIPREYRNASDAELHERICTAKRALRESAVLLGHFYQRDEIVCHADFLGDSFQLAQAAKSRPEAEYIVFCGVHFMAETAAVLSGSDQKVILPNLAAGCSMADMADIDSVRDCWDDLTALLGYEAGGKQAVLPVTYMNSAAALKGFCGEHGGVVCTSSNAESVLEWAFERGERVLFFPDQHLGRNTAKKIGVPLEQMPVWNPDLPLGGLKEEQIHNARVILWHGFCSVHKRFTVDQIALARMRFPDVHVIVHPECTMDVVNAADSAGSTEKIRAVVEAAPAGSVFAS